MPNEQLPKHAMLGHGDADAPAINICTVGDFSQIERKRAAGFDDNVSDAAQLVGQAREGERVNPRGTTQNALEAPSLRSPLTRRVGSLPLRERGLPTPSENRAPDPDKRRPESHRRFEIRAHPHGEASDVMTPRKLRKQSEIGSG